MAKTKCKFDLNTTASPAGHFMKKDDVQSAILVPGLFLDTITAALTGIFLWTFLDIFSETHEEVLAELQRERERGNIRRKKTLTACPVRGLGRCSGWQFWPAKEVVDKLHDNYKLFEKQAKSLSSFAPNFSPGAPLPGWRGAYWTGVVHLQNCVERLIKSQFAETHEYVYTGRRIDVETCIEKETVQNAD